MKTKIKSHVDKVTDFYDTKIPKVDFKYEVNVFREIVMFGKYIFWVYQVLPNWPRPGKGSGLKNWMLEKPVNNKGYSNIQFLLR